MKRTREHEPSSVADSRVDATLRGALEPEAATVDRLVREALAEPATRPGRRPWRLIVAAAAAVVAAVALPALWRETPGSRPAADPPREQTAAPRTLRISNEDGPVTVTTPAGSKLVFLTRADRGAESTTVPGGAS